MPHLATKPEGVTLGTGEGAGAELDGGGEADGVGCAVAVTVGVVVGAAVGIGVVVGARVMVGAAVAVGALVGVALRTANPTVDEPPEPLRAFPRPEDEIEVAVTECDPSAAAEGTRKVVLNVPFPFASTVGIPAGLPSQRS